MSDFDAGCSFANARFVKGLQLPDGAQVLGVRLFYYNDATPSNQLVLRLRSFTGRGDGAILLTGFADGDNGYENEFFAPSSTLVIQNKLDFYELTVGMSSGMRLCGMRVQYTM